MTTLRRIGPDLEKVRNMADRVVTEMRLVNPEAVEAAVELQVALAGARTAYDELTSVLEKKEVPPQTSP